MCGFFTIPLMLIRIQAQENIIQKRDFPHIGFILPGIFIWFLIVCLFLLRGGRLVSRSNETVIATETSTRRNHLVPNVVVLEPPMSQIHTETADPPPYVRFQSPPYPSTAHVRSTLNGLRLSDYTSEFRNSQTDNSLFGE